MSLVERARRLARRVLYGETVMAFAGLRFDPARNPDFTADTDLDISLRLFAPQMRRLAAPHILELGTRRSNPAVSTMRRDWVPHAARYIGTDLEPGLDVDVVADVHRLSQHFASEEFDAVISTSTFEHVKYPWVAALEIAKVLKPGGYFFIQTHHTFVVHAYPNDYWRFTTDGLKALFGPAIGFEVVVAHYSFPCTILSKERPEQAGRPSFLNVCLLARKVQPTPERFLLDFTTP